MIEPAVSGWTAIEPFIVRIGLPPKALSPNSRVHWSKRAKATREYRTTAYAIAIASGAKFWGGKGHPIRIESVWYCARDPLKQTCAPRDSTNAQACLKAAIDGLVDAGLVPDDSAKWVSLGVPVLHRRKKDHHGKRLVILTIWPMA